MRDRSIPQATPTPAQPARTAVPQASLPAATHACRPGCGACCIAPSISSPIPGMPVVNGISKPAGVRCIQLSDTLQCLIFGRPDRPAVCASLKPDPDMCGDNREQAMRWLGHVESATAP